MKILSVSDVLLTFIYSPQVRARFNDVDLVIACGDLPYYYQEYILNMLDVPLFYVRGNHDQLVEHGQAGRRTGPDGGEDLHRRTVSYKGLLLAGVEGSLRYRPGNFQYSQAEMWEHVWTLVPSLLRNRLIYGRYLDILVTHSPPRGTNDLEDLPHRGIDAFRWLIQTLQPAYHFHGHVHIYRPDTDVETLIGQTRVINTYGFRETVIPDYRQIKTGLRASRRT
jgi:Icc-related predicted phosphoesterase